MSVPHEHLLQFLLLLALIIAAAKAGGWASLRIGQPAVLGEIMAGVLLGPSALHLLSWPVFSGANQGAVIAHLANLGVIFLMFVAGLETDLHRMRMVGVPAALAGTAGVVVPLVLGMVVALPFGYSLAQSAFIGIVLTATSVSITVQTLIELGQLTSKEGTTLLAAAVIDDVIALLVLSAFIAFVGAGGAGAAGIGALALRIVLFFAVAILLGAWAMRRMLKTALQLPVSEGLLAATIAVMLLYAWAAEAFGHVAAITGAYVAGVLVAQAGFREEIEHKLREFIYAVLVPVFFISIGLQTDIRALGIDDVPFAFLVIAAAIVGKIIGCGAGALAGGFTPPEALRIGAGMVSRGEVGLILATIGVQTGLLTERGFAVMVVMVIATTVITPVLLRWAFPKPRLTEAEAVAEIMGEREE